MEQVTDSLARELQRQQRELALVLQNAPELILRVDGEDRLLFANPIAQRLIGLGLEDIIGEPLFNIARIGGIPEEDLSRWSEVRNQVFRSGEAHDFAFSIVPRRSTESDISDSDSKGEEHTRYFESRLIPEFDEDGNVVSILGICRDVTELRRTERELAEHRETLQHSQRLEAIGRLAGGVAHDFNNILTALGGYTQLLKHITSDESCDPNVSRYLGELESGVQRAARLTHQLLLFSRKAPAEREVFDMRDAIESMLGMLGRIIEPRISVTTDVPSDPLEVYGDRGKLEQVVANLVINARDAIEEDGTITVSAGRITDERIALSVSDTGIGMSEEVCSRVFEPYFTTKTSGLGTGLGLAVVESIVREHDGSIAVDSAPGEGTTFTITLPTALSHAPSGERDGLASSGTDGAAVHDSSFPVVVENELDRISILVVEDEEGIRDILHTALGEGGYEVYSAAGVREAKEFWQRDERPDIDAFILDVMLPDGTGLALAKDLGVLEKLPIVFTSGYLGDSDDIRQLEEAGYLFVQKPYSLDRLLETLGRALEEGPTRNASADNSAIGL